jgi:outer membrane murein-binding lipoprotein Lpp
MTVRNGAELLQQPESDSQAVSRRLAWAGARLLSIDEEKRTVEYVLSDDTVDSYDEIVEQTWRLERFKKNPVVLYSHNRQSGAGWFGGSGLTQGETFPVGRILPDTLKRKGNKTDGYYLAGTVQFIPEEVIAKMGSDGERIEAVWQLVRSQFLRAGSVGFYPHTVKVETHDDVERYVLSDNELFEFSVCPIGANANAVSNSLGSREERRAYLAQRVAECAKRSGNNEPQPAASGQEKSMQENELRAKLAELEKLLDASRSNEKAALELAQSHEKQVGELNEKVEQLSADVAAAARDLAVANEELVRVRTERDEYESDAIESEIQSYVGKKCHAGELDDLREDRRRLGKVPFAERMARRADLATSKQLIANETNELSREVVSETTDSSESACDYLNQKACV